MLFFCLRYACTACTAIKSRLGWCLEPEPVTSIVIAEANRT